MIDPTSFLLGMLAHDFLSRSLKKSQVTAVLVAMLFGVVLLDVLIRLGAFTSITYWWNGLPR